MGWKRVKEYYNIKHIVQVASPSNYGNVPCILIGSPYISNIIAIRISDAKILKRYTDGRFTNSLLYELQPLLDKDEKNGTLKQLIDEQDTFERLLPVYCIEDDKHIVKMYCEHYGYPNVTVEGKLMYENIFYSKIKAARFYLLRRSDVCWRWWWRNVCNKFGEIGRLVKSLRYPIKEIWNFIYVRCWGRFFIKEYKTK